jgi:hypothetical protein
MIEAEHARLRRLAARIECGRAPEKRTALLARFAANFEMHRCMVEELFPAPGETADPVIDPWDGDAIAQHERSEQAALATLDALAPRERAALGRRFAQRRAELNAWFCDRSDVDAA